MDFDSIWDRADQDVTQVLDKMHKERKLRLREDGRYDCITSSVDNLSPYLFFKEERVHDKCYIYYDVFFMQFNMIPSHCQSQCWKVVVKNHTFAQFWRTFGILSESGLYGKGGADERQHSYGLWPIFIYGKSPEEGKSNWQKVVKLIGFDRARDVIMKQGCTEMEMKVPTKQWRVTKMQQEIENEVLNRLVIPPEPTTIRQPEWLQKKKIRDWVKVAHMVGDMSYQEIFGPIPLYPKIVTYQTGEWLKEVMDDSEKEKHDTEKETERGRKSVAGNRKAEGDGRQAA
jgi:hypothetical protein